MTLDRSGIRTPLALLVLPVLLVVVTVVLGVLGPSAGQPAPTAHTASSAGPAPGTHWNRVVEELGEQRSRAWRRRGPALLDQVFVPGSAPWREERRLMRAYTGRGLRVLGLSLIVDDVFVTDSGSGWVQVSLVDTVHPSVAVGRDGRRHRLPRDSATCHLVTLERSHLGWRIRAVRVVRS